MSFDFDTAVSAPFRMQPGLRRLAAGAAQLTPLAPGSRHQREKLAVLSAFPEMALQQRAGFDPRPALHALAAHAAAEHPHAFAWDGQRAEARLLGTAVNGTEVEQLAAGRFGLGDEIARCLRPLPAPWRLPALIALSFAEDFAVVDAGDASIPWLAVCLPSHWAPQEKVGRPFAEVHAPVADAALILRAAEHLVKLVTGDERWERFVWNVTGHPRLHAHPRHVDPQRWPADIAATLPAGAWWRSERQTFIPLPARRQAVFTIGVQCEPLASAIDTPQRARALHDAIESMSAAVLDYRNLKAVRAPLLAWLASAS
jgi:dimethylamine monooxygenase subunit A